MRAHLAESISIEMLAELAELSHFHFCRVFKQATGMSPLQFVTRERMLRAQRLIRETPRSQIEIGLEVGYTSPSYFAQVFRRTVGESPLSFATLFRSKKERTVFPQEYDKRSTITRAATADAE